MKNMATGNISPTGLLTSDVLYFELEDDGWFCVRPSGTEPKIKYYAGVRGASGVLDDAKLRLDRLLAALADE